MSCDCCGIIPPFLQESIRDHVAANPSFYAELSAETEQREGEPPYDEREYLEYWRVNDESDHSGAAAAAAGAGAGRQTASDSSDDDDSSSDDARGVAAGGGRRTRAAPPVLSESLITQLQPPSSWQYTGWDAAAQRSTGAAFVVAAAGAAPGAAVSAPAAAGGGTVVAAASTATAMAISATKTALLCTGVVASAAAAKTEGGVFEQGAAAVAASKKFAQRTARLPQFYFAMEDLGPYFTGDRPQQIFISDASSKTNHGADICSESPYPRTLQGIQDRANNPCAIRTYQAIEQSLAFLNQRFKRNSIDDDGQMVIASIHYPREDGHRRLSNAFWTPRKQQMLIGDGDGLILNELGLDFTTIAHETFHGMTQHAIGLRYSGQSGALDEHISDVFAILVKNNTLWENPSTNITGDGIWYIGEDLVRPTYVRKLAQKFPGQFFHALRSMKNPGSAYNLGAPLTARTRLPAQDPQVSDMRHYVRTTADNGGVHINSGIPNKAFYLFATTVGNEALKTAGKIWYATITSKRLQPTAQFIDFANETLRHVEPTNLAALRKAWRDVGITV
ncbi:MAG: M4 family metallopeptidase [Simkaniaceae bacterium]|nr:M4 family metallopeptidase [Candidatus Sacchlamyda saccharinae]